MAQLEYCYANGSALHVERRWAPAWAVRTFVGPFLYRAAEQDRRAVEAQAVNSERFGRRDGICTELDLMRPALDAAWLPNGKPVEQGERVMQMWV